VPFVDKGTALSREEIVNYWNAAVYCVCLIVLGVSVLKAVVITLLVLTCMALRYGARWVMRGGFALLALTVLVWIGALPPPEQWHEITAHAINWPAHAVTAAR
jgi:hypothetical protein